MNIDEMQAGPELNALIAEKVMGWTWLIHNKKERVAILPPEGTGWIHWNFVPGDWTKIDSPEGRLLFSDWDKQASPDPKGSSLPLTFLPHYSTDIAAAWEIVKSLGVKKRCRVTIQFGDYEDQELVSCVYINNVNGNSAEGRANYSEMPLAICRAALKAVMDE